MNREGSKMHDGIQANPSRGDLLNDPAIRYKCWPEYDSHFTPVRLV